VRSRKRTIGARRRIRRENDNSQFINQIGVCENHKQTIERLESMANLGPVLLGRDLTYPEFALVRGDPRVKALRKKVGLPE